MVPPLLVSLAACVLAASPAVDTPTWSFSADQDIVFFRLTPIGTLVVSTGNALLGLDPASGAVLWKREDIRGLQASAYQNVPGSARALVNLGPRTGSDSARVELLDLESGRSRWDSRRLRIPAALGHLFVPHRQLVVMYTVPPAETSLTWQGDRGPWTFVAVRVDDGTLAWTTDRLVRAPPLTTVRRGSDGEPVRTLLGGGRGMVFDTDSTAILDLSREGPVRLDLATGERLWPTAPPESLGTKGSPGNAGLAVDGDVLFAARHGRLQALDLADGRVLWERAPCAVHDLRVTPRGLLVSTSAADPNPALLAAGGALAGAASHAALGVLVPTGFVGNALRARHLDLLDPHTGASLWKKPVDIPWRPKNVKAKGDFAPFDLRGDTVYVGGDQVLRGVRLTDGAVFELARFGESEDDWPEAIEARASGVLLRTRDGLLSLDPTTRGRYGPFGATRFQRQVAGPGWSNGVTIGLSLLVVGAAIVFVNTALGDVHDAYDHAYGPQMGPVMARLSGAEAEVVAVGVGGTVAGLELVLAKRYQSRRLAESSLYVLTTVRNARGASGPGLARVDKDTGRIEGSVLLRFQGRGDRAPVYEVDDLDRRLYYRNSPRTIACYPI